MTRWLVALTLLEIYRISPCEERWKTFCFHFLLGRDCDCWKKEPMKIVSVPLSVLKKYGMAKNLSVGEIL